MIKVEIKGLKELQARMERGKEHLRKETAAILERGAQKWVRDAKRDAPVDMGVLRNSISYHPNGPLTFSIVSGSKYSPYLEWGTITKVEVPGDLSSYATQFKGRGIRKSGGIIPRPFFFRQRPTVKADVERMIDAMLKDI